MSRIIKTIAASAFAVSFASIAVAQSGPVDSKGQAGAVQQLGSGVTKGTNAQDAGKSRAQIESATGGGTASSSDMSTGSVGPSTATMDSPGGPPSSPQEGTR